MKTPTFESSRGTTAERGPRWLWLPEKLSPLVQELSEQFTGTTLCEAQPCQHSWTLCYLHSCNGDAAWPLPRNGASPLEAGKSSGVSMRPGTVGFMVQMQVHIYLAHNFSATLHCLHKLSCGSGSLYSAGMRNHSLREGLENMVNSILVSYGHLVLRLHQAGSKHRGNSSLWVKLQTFPQCQVVFTSAHRTVSSLTLVLLRAAGLLLTALTNPVFHFYVVIYNCKSQDQKMASKLVSNTMLKAARKKWCLCFHVDRCKKAG